MEPIELARRNLQDAVTHWHPPEGIAVLQHSVHVKGESIYLTMTIRAHGVEQTVSGSWLYWIFTDMATDAMKELHRRWSENIKRIARRDGNVPD